LSFTHPERDLDAELKKVDAWKREVLRVILQCGGDHHVEPHPDYAPDGHGRRLAGVEVRVLPDPGD